MVRFAFQNRLLLYGIASALMAINHLMSSGYIQGLLNKEILGFSLMVITSFILAIGAVDLIYHGTKKFHDWFK